METFGWKNVIAPAIVVEYIRVTATRLVTCVAGASTRNVEDEQRRCPGEAVCAESDVHWYSRQGGPSRGCDETV